MTSDTKSLAVAVQVGPANDPVQTPVPPSTMLAAPAGPAGSSADAVVRAAGWTAA